MSRLCLLFTLAACGLYSDANGQSVDSVFMRAAYARLERAAAYTLSVANAMPAESYAYRPSPGEMTFGQQLTHLSRNLGWLSSYYLGDKDQNPVSEADLKLQGKDSIIAVVNRTYGYALAVLNRFPPDRLTDTVPFFAGPMSKLQIINLINDHQTHHRGQLVVYLRLNRIQPPAYVGW